MMSGRPGEDRTMTDSRQHVDTDTAAAPASRQPAAMSKSMHDGVAVWCDCCSCEMEPYWEEVAREMEAVFSDHEA
jgi:hypothetical protein